MAGHRAADLDRVDDDAVDLAVDVVLDHATLLTMDDGRPGPLAGARQGELGRVDDGAVAVGGGRIVAVGPRDAGWRPV